MLAYVLALASGLIWGGTFSLARLLTEAGLPPLGIALWQAVGGSLVLLGFCLWRRQLPRIDRRWLVHAGMVGLLGSAVPSTVLLFAAPHVPAGLLAITIALAPILTYAASLLLRSDRYSGRRLAGILAGFAAVLLILQPASPQSIDVAADLANDLAAGLAADPSPGLPASALGRTAWLTLALLAVLSYTLENLYVDRRVEPAIGMPGLLLGGMLAAGLMLLPVVLLTDSFVSIHWPLDRIDLWLLLMAIVSSLAYLMYLVLIRLAGAVFASLSGYVVTVSGVFWGMWLFGERHSATIWIALVLMLIGLALVTPRRRQNSAASVG